MPWTRSDLASLFGASLPSTRQSEQEKMLIGLKEALDFGEQHTRGIVAINTPTFEMLVATINVAERYNIPMILQHAECA